MASENQELNYEELLKLLYNTIDKYDNMESNYDIANKLNFQMEKMHYGEMVDYKRRILKLIQNAFSHIQFLK